jgi:hypothetical protein
MALRYAVATGNWSNTATWDGGTLPTVGDDVHANGFTVAINQDITVNKISTKAQSPAVSGGLFTIAAPSLGERYIVANIEAGSSNCCRIDNGNGFTYITGNIYGGDVASASGLALNSTISDSSRQPVITGNIYGGTAANTHGISARADRSYQPTIYGNIEAGVVGLGVALSLSQGVNNVVTIYGNVKAAGGEGIVAPRAICFGSVEASNTFHGIRTPFDAYISGIMKNVAGYWAVYSPKIFINTSGSMEFTLNEQTTDNDITLYSQDLFSSPSGSDVRDGITYGAGGALTGSLAVPPSGSVALGVPVDDGVGTAMISITDMGALLASYII